MQVFLSVFVLWTLVNASVAYVGEAVAEARKMASNSVDSGCHIFANTVSKIPIREPSIDNVGFQLRTPCKHIDIYTNEAVGLRALAEFNETQKTVIFVGGWMTGPGRYHITDLTKAYLCRGGYNFMVAKSGYYIHNLYINSAYHTKKLAQYLAKALYNTGLPAANIHLIGHSLGAHIVGIMGRHFHQLSGKKIQRITALDPARPCFKTPATFPRVSADDGVFVDAIHTNPFDLGMEEPVADVDFYVEGLDVIKPGCSSFSPPCSHELAIQYYLETVYPQLENSFMASKCDNYAALEEKKCNGIKSPMGYATPNDLRGIYYVSAQKHSPYGPDASIDGSFRKDKCGVCHK